MPTSELFLTRALSDIAPRRPAVKKIFEDMFSRTKRANPAEIHNDAEDLVELFGVTLNRDKENPSALKYTHPVIVKEWSGIALSVREDIGPNEDKSYTFVALRYEGDDLIEEQDLVTYSQRTGIDSKGNETDDEFNASVKQALKEIEGELTHWAIINQARREAGVDFELSTNS